MKVFWFFKHIYNKKKIMSKIITKKDLDLVVESTLKEAGLLKEDGTENYWEKERQEGLAKAKESGLSSHGDSPCDGLRRGSQELKDCLEYHDETITGPANLLSNVSESEEVDTDIVQESVDNLVKEVNKSTLNEELSKELDSFKRFTNFKL